MYNIIYFFAVMLFAIGLLIIIISNNYVRKIIGLGIFQSAVLIFYIALGKIEKAIAPINQCFNQSQEECYQIYSSPLPHTLMLTAIVVGFATLSVALAMIAKIFKIFGAISENDITHHSIE
jgi:multicomponent Na+:H+ antiporter subunit C